jgi:hypothetical protein
MDGKPGLATVKPGRRIHFILPYLSSFNYLQPILAQTIRERAGYRCEYCSLPQDAEPFFAYHVEHIVARQHGGGDDSGNLVRHSPLGRETEGNFWLGRQSRPVTHKGRTRRRLTLGVG